MRTHIIYHANCRDGFGAALAAWMRFGSDADYIPAQYGDRPPKMEGPGEVFIVDFSYPREQLVALAAQHERVVVLDHHKTAAEALEGLPDPGQNMGSLSARFDMGKSGAVLAWEFFHPDTFGIPVLMDFLQDRDLWQWRLPASREVSAGVDLLPFEFSAWAPYIHDVNELRERGEIVLAYQRKIVEQSANNARQQGIGNTVVPVVNTGVLISEVCEELLRRHPDAPFAACYFDQADKRVYSLRSRDGSDVDVSAVAKTHGGGGHKHAAGFSHVIP